MGSLQKILVNFSGLKLGTYTFSVKSRTQIWYYLKSWWVTIRFFFFLAKSNLFPVECNLCPNNVTYSQKNVGNFLPKNLTSVNDPKIWKWNYSLGRYPGTVLLTSYNLLLPTYVCCCLLVAWLKKTFPVYDAVLRSRCITKLYINT